MKSGREGFTLLELVVAVVILTYGVLGLAGTTLYAVRQMTLADMDTRRALAVQSVVERIRTLPFDSIVVGSDSIGAFEVRWTSSVAGRLKSVQVVSSGPGLVTLDGAPRISAQVADTFRYRMVRP